MTSCTPRNTTQHAAQRIRHSTQHTAHNATTQHTMHRWQQAATPPNTQHATHHTEPSTQNPTHKTQHTKPNATLQPSTHSNTHSNNHSGCPLSSPLSTPFPPGAVQLALWANTSPLDTPGSALPETQPLRHAPSAAPDRRTVGPSVGGDARAAGSDAHAAGGDAHAATHRCVRGRLLILV